MKQEISFKKYVITFVLFICSIIVGIYIINYYSNTKEYRNSENCIMNFLSVVDADSLDSYLVDNHEAIIYISSSNNQDVRKYEQQLKKYIIQENLEKSILYLDASNLEDSFYDNFQKKYNISNDVNLKNSIPNLIVIVDGKVTNILYNNTHELDIEKTKAFLKENTGV